MSQSFNKPVKKWMIISWQRNDLMDGSYGELLNVIKGTYEDAAEAARWYVPARSPVGVVGEIE